LRQRETRLHVAEIEHHIGEPKQESSNPCSSCHFAKRAKQHFDNGDFFHDQIEQYLDSGRSQRKKPIHSAGFPTEHPMSQAEGVTQKTVHGCAKNFRYSLKPTKSRPMLRSIFTILFATVMWVQVPQWQNDWSQCAVDVPDVDCHWYVVAPDNTFGEGFDWASAPWFDPNGLQDVANLNNTMSVIHNNASSTDNA
tara:strand:+ start:431 stop:1015 length:585 start_codon:yes stop_codon:yes gene_type:complete